MDQCAALGTCWAWSRRSRITQRPPRRSFQRAVRLAPRLESAWLNLGRLYQTGIGGRPTLDGEPQGSLRNQFWKLNPASAEAWHHQSALLLFLKREFPRFSKAFEPSSPGPSKSRGRGTDPQVRRPGRAGRAPPQALELAGRLAERSRDGGGATFSWCCRSFPRVTIPSTFEFWRHSTRANTPPTDLAAAGGGIPAPRRLEVMGAGNPRRRSRRERTGQGSTAPWTSPRLAGGRKTSRGLSDTWPTLATWIRKTPPSTSSFALSATNCVCQLEAKRSIEKGPGTGSGKRLLQLRDGLFSMLLQAWSDKASAQRIPTWRDSSP